MFRILCLLLCLNLIPALVAGEATGEGAAPATPPATAPASETPKSGPALAPAPGSEAPQGGPGGGADQEGGPTGDPAKDGQQPNKQEPKPDNSMFTLIMIGLAVFLVFMFISQGRAQKREKATRETMLGTMKIGDKVVTIGGLHGEVVRKGEGTVDLKINEMPGGQVTFSLSAVAKVNPDESAVADKDKDA